jgi:hypothetical protein
MYEEILEKIMDLEQVVGLAICNPGIPTREEARVTGFKIAKLQAKLSLISQMLGFIDKY